GRRGGGGERADVQTGEGDGAGPGRCPAAARQSHDPRPSRVPDPHRPDGDERQRRRGGAGVLTRGGAAERDRRCGVRTSPETARSYGIWRSHRTSLKSALSRASGGRSALALLRPGEQVDEGEDRRER